ncbi:MAG: Gfo/Idh/MocA family oxidoreductase [Bacteroidetes bacterium]|nr:Gfo/Idh/MocA family oxidoreductase [Bacteroidota bacterium]
MQRKTGNRAIEIGIIGTGMMAHSHAISFQRIPGVRITACCDTDPNRATAFAKLFGIPHVFSDHNQLLQHAGLTAVSIVTTDDVHPEIAIAAAREKISVLCEKPLALTTELAVEMADEAERSGIVAMVNFSYRRSAALCAAQKLVSAGSIGQIRHVRAHYLQSWLVSDAWGDWKTGPQWLWRLSKSHGSLGVLGDVGIHLLDFATYPVGPIKDVQCRLTNLTKNEGNPIGPYTLDANDSASISCTYENGAMGVFQLSRWATGHLNSVEISIHGDLGAIAINLDESYSNLKICRGKNVHKAKWELRSYEAAPSVYELFVRALRNRKSLEPTFRRGAEVQKMLAACQLSAETGQTQVVR